MTAKIDGQAWTSAVTAQQAQVGGFGVIQLSGSQNGTTISLVLYNIDSLGTYALGVSGTTVGGYGQVTDLTSRAWSTPLSGGSGTVTLTALTSGHIAGTFVFSADSLLGGAHGTRAVTQGAFDLPLAGTLATLPDQYGSNLSGTFGADPFNGATVVMTLAGTTLVIGANNTSYSLSIGVSGFTGAASYPVGTSPGNAIVVVSGPAANPNGAVHCCWGTTAGSTGTVTVTSVTATRIKGSIAATLVPNSGTAATTPISIAADFDLGRP
jgi:hypothetical protein